MPVLLARTDIIMAQRLNVLVDKYVSVSDVGKRTSTM